MGNVVDPIGDMLTRIRNALKEKHKSVDIPASNMKTAIVEIMLNNKFINNYKYLKDGKQGILRIFLGYDKQNRGTVKGLKRVSKPGLRVYVSKNEIPKMQEKLRVCVLSTSKGIMTDREARKEGVGGEVLCYIW